MYLSLRLVVIAISLLLTWSAKIKQNISFQVYLVLFNLCGNVRILWLSLKYQFKAKLKINLKTHNFKWSTQAVRSLCIHRLPWKHTTWLYLFRDIHGVFSWTHTCTHLSLQGNEFWCYWKACISYKIKVCEKSGIAHFLQKLNVSCSLQ